MSILILIKVDICIGMDYTSTRLHRGLTQRMFCGSKYLTHDFFFKSFFTRSLSEFAETAFTFGQWQ